MKKPVRVLALLIVCIFCLTACTTADPNASSGPSSSSSSAKTSGADSSSASSISAGDSKNTAVPDDESKIYIGIVAARTGTKKATGEMALNGAQLAVDEINAAGGILGKTLVLVDADEIDSVDSSVNAANRLLADKRISAIVGSQYSPNILAILPQVLDAKIPLIALGSNELIAQKKNPFVWQPRNFDGTVSQILAQYAHDKVNVKKPAFIYSTLPNTVGLAEVGAAYFKDKFGIEVPSNMMFAYNEDEKDFAPIIAQIANSGADGLFCYGTQNPCVLIAKAMADAGLDIPKFANSSMTSSIILNNAGKAADGWICVPDWAPYINTPVGSAFQKAYLKRFNMDTENSMAFAYDAVQLIGEAIRISGNAYDRQAINEGLGKIKDYEGVLGIFTAQSDHTFLSTAYITQTVDGKVLLKEVVTYR